MLALAASVAAVTVASLGLAATRPGEDQDSADAVASPVEYRLPAGPSGIITYSVSGHDPVVVTATGGPANAAPGARLARTQPSVPDEFPAPDGTVTAVVIRGDSGVVLALREGNLVRQTAQLAGPDSPALVDGGKVQAAAVKGVPLVVAWSPDSRTVAYGSLVGEPFTLNVASRDSGLTKVRDGAYTLSGGYVGELAWSPDGRWLAVSTYTMDRKNHTVFVLSAATGSLRRLSDGCHITWSPDSRFLAIHRDPQPEPGAWVISVESGESYALSRDPQAYPHSWDAE
jgi:WD40 repeat protein